MFRGIYNINSFIDENQDSYEAMSQLIDILIEKEAIILPCACEDHRSIYHSVLRKLEATSNQESHPLLDI